MIKRKEIFLLVLENGQPVKKPLLKVDLNGNNHKIDCTTYERYWFNRGLPYKLKDFASFFLNVNKRVRKKFQKVIEEYPYLHMDINLEEALNSVTISFADNNIFEQTTKNKIRIDEEDDEKDIKAGAKYLNKEILISQNNSKVVDSTCKTLIHEYAHFLDELLNPIEYPKRTATMCEVMAIIAQEEFGIRRTYKNPPHSRAQGIIRFLENTRFRKLSFPHRWIYLSNVLNHREAYLKFIDDFGFKIPKKSYFQMSK